MNLKAYLNLNFERNSLNTDAVIFSWKPLRQNAVKVNVDFAVDDGNGIHGFGISIRDERGSFRATKSIQGWALCNLSMGDFGH